MKTTAAVLFVSVAFAAGCASGARVVGGDGSSVDAAAVVTGARSLEQLTATMDTWISNHMPGGRLNPTDSRYILSNRVIYAARVDLPAGQQRVVYFDVTDLPRQ